MAWYICFALCIRDGVASRTYFASRMIIDFLCQMPQLPSVFIGLPKLARMESRAAERVVVRAESVEHRRTRRHLIRSYPLYLRSCTFISVQPPFPDLRVVAQSMTIGKWYRESREFHSILDDLQALPLFRKVRWVKWKGADIVVTDTIRCSQWLQGMAGTHRCICDEAEG